MSNHEQDRKYTLLGLRIVGEFGAIIAVPVVLLSLLGQWLDRRYGTPPIFLLVGFVLAALLSGISLWRRAREFGQEYDSIEPKTPQSDDGDDDSNRQ